MRMFYALAITISFALSAKFAEEACESILLAQESGAARDAAVRQTTVAIETAQSWKDGYEVILKEAKASNAVTRDAIAAMERINSQWQAVLRQCADGRRSE